MAMDTALTPPMAICASATQAIERASLKCVKASHRFTLNMYNLKILFYFLCYTCNESIVTAVSFLSVLKLFVLDTLSDPLHLQTLMNALN